MGYAQSGAISAFFKEKASVEDFVKEHSNILIRAAKSIDKAVIGVEALECWEQLKVHGMSLARYFGERKMELLSGKIEFLTKIKLKTTPHWLINKARLEKHLESGDGRGSAIVIIVRNSIETSQLYSKELRFGGTLKVVEKYWEAELLSICMSCTEIRHD